MKLAIAKLPEFWRGITRNRDIERSAREWMEGYDAALAYCAEQLDQALSHAAGQDGEQCRAASGGYRWLEELRERMEHCVSAADEGEDYAVPREMLDAMTTLGLMEKVGRGRWAPTGAGREFAERKPTLPVEIYGKCYEVPIRVQLHIVNLEEKLRALSRGVPEGMVLVPRSSAEMAAVVCDEWGELFFGTPGFDKYERFTYGPAVEMLRDELRAIAAQRKEGE